MDEQEIEQKDTTSHLYKLIPTTKATIIDALTIYEKLPFNINRPNVTVARQALEYPIEKIVSAPLVISEPTTVIQHNDPLREAQWANSIEAFKRYILVEIQRAVTQEAKDGFQRLLKKFEETV